MLAYCDTSALLKRYVDELGRRQVLRLRYGRSGGAEQVLLDEGVVVESLAYDARGQQVLMVLGNDVLTRAAYDERTNRLTRVQTRRSAQPEPARYVLHGAVLQDLEYRHDVVGNLIAEIERVESLYAPVARSIVELASEHRQEEAVRKINDECRPLLAALVAATDAYSTHTHRRADELVADAHEHYVAQMQILAAICLGSLAAAVLAGVLITRGLTRALGTEPGEVAREDRVLARIVGRRPDDLSDGERPVGGDAHPGGG